MAQGYDIESREIEDYYSNKYELTELERTDKDNSIFSNIKPLGLCPYRYKWQLVDWAVSYFNQPSNIFRRMSKKQLYAIWYKICDKEGDVWLMKEV